MCSWQIEVGWTRLFSLGPLRLRTRNAIPPTLDKNGQIRGHARALRQLSATWMPRVEFRVPIFSDTGADGPGSPEQ
eukprot:6903275-Pyramimonas_sp.AAC.1